MPVGLPGVVDLDNVRMVDAASDADLPQKLRGAAIPIVNVATCQRFGRGEHLDGPDLALRFSGTVYGAKPTVAKEGVQGVSA